MTRRARTSVAKVSALALGLVLFAASCASNAPQDTFKPKGPKADKIDRLIMPVFGVAGVVFVVILGGAVWVAFKFRARDDEDYDEFPAQVHGHFKAEIGWTIAPAVVLAVVGAFTVSTIIDLAKKPPADALEVEVWGQQWWWEYRYHVDVDGDGKKETIITANDMVIPTDREISLKISSHDVIHSWWAPALNGKKDAVPGRVHPLTINAPDPGEYIGQCTEFCGLSHAEMRIKVVALDPADWKAWLEQQVQPFEAPKSGPAADGFSLFASQCTSCHRITGMTDPADPTKQFTYPSVINQVSKNAPNLTKFMTRSTFAGAKFNLRKDTEACKELGEDWANTSAGIAKCLNRADLEAWLRDPPAQKAMHAGDQPSTSSRGMPNFNLSEDQIDTLVAFLTTLK